MTDSLSNAIHWDDDNRKSVFEQWLQVVTPTFDLISSSLEMASADASFRRYFRIKSAQGQSFVVMDAPPEKENSAPFVEMAQLLQEAGVHGPHVLNWDSSHGFMLLTDLGHRTVLTCLNAAEPAANLGYFVSAIDQLIKLQLASRPQALPLYDQPLLLREVKLFDQWYLEQHKGLTLTPAQQQVLASTYHQLIEHNLSSASVFVHRDFMPRNLMVPDTFDPSAGAPLGTPVHLGVLDFQDAVYGPITYDIASLTRDAFWTWEEDFVLDVTIRYWEKARKAGLPVPDDFGDFYRAVDWMALQRHLKVAGIFARLTLRDGKPKYLADTPRFIDYIRQTAGRYRELKPLLRLIDEVEGLQALSGFAYGRM